MLEVTSAEKPPEAKHLLIKSAAFNVEGVGLKVLCWKLLLQKSRPEAKHLLIKSAAFNVEGFRLKVLGWKFLLQKSRPEAKHSQQPKT